MELYTYFELKELPSNYIKSEYISLILGVSGIIISSLIFIFKDKINYDQKLLIAWTLLFVGIISTGLYFHSLTTKKLYNTDPIVLLKKQNLLDSAEGYISDFKIEYRHTRGGQRTLESFKIDSHIFQYNDYPAAKFNNFSKTQKEGGILKNGLYAKILFIDHHYENRIVKIELER